MITTTFISVAPITIPAMTPPDRVADWSWVRTVTQVSSMVSYTVQTIVKYIVYDDDLRYCYDIDTSFYMDKCHRKRRRL